MEEQLVVFDLAHESYGIAIGCVQEINRMQSVTVVPQAPAFVCGIINLRGRVTPVVDLRERFGLPKVEITSQTRIVVAKIREDWVGLVVDAVSEVLSVSAEAIEPISSLATTADSAFLRGVAKLKDRLVILLDLERVLDKDFQPGALLPA